MTSARYLCLAGVVLWLSSANLTWANNSLTVGLSSFYDYDDRQYDEADGRDNDYNRIGLTPLIHYVFSSSETDTFELRAAPNIKYDLDDSNTDWNNNLFAGASKSITNSWRINASNAFVKSDYSRDSNDNTTNDAQVSSSDTNDNTTSDGQVSSSDTTPELSPDLGRKRYWRNTFTLGSDYNYSKQSSVHFGFDYIVLRNDDSGIEEYNDYDRYAFTLEDEHVYNRAWSSFASLKFVRGDYDEKDRFVVEEVVDTIVPETEIPISDNDLSNDLKEYRVLLNIDNKSLRLHTFGFIYNYIGSKYDDFLRNDSDIHQARINWSHAFSPRLNMVLGLGPSYEKTEGSDANWGGNGTAQVNYETTNRSRFSFILEKRYDVQNFSGTNERGSIDFWDVRLLFNYNILQELLFDCTLGYRYEDQGEPTLADDTITAVENNGIISIEDVTKNRYTAGAGLSYSFLRHYSANIDYTYTTLDSDRDSGDYDDHRVLLTLSWQQEWLRW